MACRVLAYSTVLSIAIAHTQIEAIKSPSITEVGKKHLILAPSNLWLTIHESVGHPTELDRALGYEANMAGTSFATPIMAGVAANFWATQPGAARPTLDQINALVHSRPTVTDLGVPGVPTRLTWLP